MTSATSYQTMATFGASLTDWGGMYNLTKDIMWVPLPVAKRGYSLGYSNGEVYTVYSADLLGIDDLQSYAVGGSMARGEFTLLEFLEENHVAISIRVPEDDPRLQQNLNFQGQIDRFLADNAGQDLGDTMAVVQMGMVDYMRFVPRNNDLGLKSFDDFVPYVVDAVIAGISRLVDAGVGQVVINTLPDPSNFAFTAVMPEFVLRSLDKTIETHNAEIAAAVDQMIADGANIVTVDMNAITAMIDDDPLTFGFVASMDDHILHTGLFGNDTFELIDIYDEDQIAFYDATHPTTGYHGIMGAFQSASLTHETAFLQEADTSYTGSAQQDLVLGTETGASISVLDGNDTVIGGFSDDIIEADAGDDILSGGSGDDFVSGGLGNDVVAGGAGDDLLDGGEGNDVLIDGLGSDTLYGGLGDDHFLFTDAGLIGGVSGADSEIFVGGDGHDTLYLALGTDQRALYDASGSLAALGISVSSIEEVVLVDSRLDLAQIETDARLSEADIWGLV